jgi:group I intron endonuclease
MASHRHFLNRGTHPSKHLQNAWAKYGPAAFVFELLEVVPDKMDLTTREQHWIDGLGAHTKKGGFNMRPQAKSNLGLARSAESREKGRLKMIEYWNVPGRREAERLRVLGRKMSPEAIAKSANSRRGKKLSTKHRASLSAAHTGKPLGAQHRQAIGAGSKGKKRSPEFAAKVSAGIKKHWELRKAGRPADWTRKVYVHVTARRFTAEHRAKIAAGTRKWRSERKAQLAAGVTSR